MPVGPVLAARPGRAPRRWSARRKARFLRTMAVALVMVSATAIALASSLGAAAPVTRPARPLAVRSHPPAAAATVLSGRPDAVAAGAAQELLASAPAVVVADPGNPAGLRAAARWAVREHAPLLLASAPGAGQPAPGPVISAGTRAEIRALHARVVLAVGVRTAALAAELRGIRVVSAGARLPATRAPVPLPQVALLLRGPLPVAAALAAATTAHAAGAQVVQVRDGDPRSDPADIAALAAARPRQVLAAGAGFGPPAALAAEVAVAKTGVQLPGGGQLLFPGHRLVALYGHPGAPALGVLGQQGLAATIARARQVAAQYRRLSPVPVIPALEIIATVAEAAPGRTAATRRSPAWPRCGRG